MANANHRKGRDTEVRTAKYLVERGWKYAEATRRSGWADDRGDIDGIPGFVFECKDVKSWRLSEWVAELDAEIANARAENGVIVVKKRGTLDVGEWYAIMPMRRFTEILHTAGW